MFLCKCQLPILLPPLLQNWGLPLGLVQEREKKVLMRILTWNDPFPKSGQRDRVCERNTYLVSASGSCHRASKSFNFLRDRGAYSQGYGFSTSRLWMWELDHKEDWTQRIDAFELCCWRRLLRVPWTSRRSNQSFLKEINPEYSLEGLMLKLNLQYFGYLMSWLIGKYPDAGKDWRQKEEEEAEDEVVRYHVMTQWTWIWANSVR